LILLAILYFSLFLLNYFFLVMRIILLLAIFTLLLFSCQKEETVQRIRFNGLTVTDIFGYPFYTDTTDWKLSDVWNETEQSLFVGSSAVLCENDDDQHFIIAYPNPCIENFLILHTEKPAGGLFSFCMVDRYFNIITERDSMQNSVFAIDRKYIDVPNDTVRIYYKFTMPGCELRGHGDVLFKDQ